MDSDQPGNSLTTIAITNSDNTKRTVITVHKQVLFTSVYIPEETMCV